MKIYRLSINVLVDGVFVRALYTVSAVSITAAIVKMHAAFPSAVISGYVSF